MTNNEKDFLARVHKALGKNGATPAVRENGLFSSREEGELDALLDQAKRKKGEQLELLALLKETAAPLNLHIHEAKTPDEAGQAIAEIARTTDTEWDGDKRITTHDNPVVAALGLADKLEADNIPVEIARFENGEDEPSGKHRLREQAEASYIGVTGADWGVADCGAIALLAGPGRGRATSLVPSVHIAVLELDKLLRDLPELYAQLENLGSLPTSFNFISGPSKTADIEAQLVHGAHGPRAMHLFVITG